MATPTIADTVRDLHADLARKVALHRASLGGIWRALTPDQRGECLKAGAAEGVVLQHAQDRSLGNVYKFVPEMNLRDISTTPEFLLSLLGYRGTTSLVTQYLGSSSGQIQGDLDFIEEMMRTRNLALTTSYRNSYSIFLDDEKFGDSFKINTANRRDVLAHLQPGIQARLIVPQNTGELVLLRQQMLFQSLNILIEDILEAGETVVAPPSSKTKKKKKKSKGTKAATEAMSQLTFREQPAKLSVSDVASNVSYQLTDLKDYVQLLWTEPEVLSHATNTWFFSQPELVPDEKGRSLPYHTDKYISSALFDAVHEAVRATAVWAYMLRLLRLLQEEGGDTDSGGTDRAYRSLVLQELSNTCHLEFKRTQTLLKRCVQSPLGVGGSGSSGSKLFRRVSGAHDDVGRARVTARRKPEELTAEDPQLHYILRLCHPDTTPAQSVDWMKKLGDLHTAHPEDRDKLSAPEVEALSDMAVAVWFTDELYRRADLGLGLGKLPPLSRKLGQNFVGRARTLQAELNRSVLPDIDLRDWVVPIDNLKQPGVADAALDAMDAFVVDRAGTRLGFLYQDLVEDSLAALSAQREKLKDKNNKDSAQASPSPFSDERPVEERVAQRRQKEKTRPSVQAASVYNPEADALDATQQTSSATPPDSKPPTLAVSATTASVFTDLFSVAEARRPVNWTAFEAAMADVGFSVVPKFGSVYTFFPPDHIGPKSITLHRPHKSKIEGYGSLLIARRLRRVYGWSQRTFVTEE